MVVYESAYGGMVKRLDVKFVQVLFYNADFKIGRTKKDRKNEKSACILVRDVVL